MLSGFLNTPFAKVNQTLLIRLLTKKYYCIRGQIKWNMEVKVNSFVRLVREINDSSDIIENNNCVISPKCWVSQQKRGINAWGWYLSRRIAGRWIMIENSLQIVITPCGTHHATILASIGLLLYCDGQKDVIPKVVQLCCQCS